MSINFLLILLSEDTLYMQCFSDNINSKFNLGDTGKKKKKLLDCTHIFADIPTETSTHTNNFTVG